MPSGGPHLLTVDQPLVAVEHGGGGQRGQVGAGVGFAETLAPAHGAVEDPWQELLLLVLGAPLQDRRADEGVAEEIGTKWGLGPGELLGQHHALHGGEPLPAVLLGPRCADPPALEQLLRPPLVERLALIRRHLEAGVTPSGREVRGQPLADLGTKGLVLGGVPQMHHSSIHAAQNHPRVLGGGVGHGFTFRSHGPHQGETCVPYGLAT